MGKGDNRGKTKLVKLALEPIKKRQPNGQRRERKPIPRDPRKTALEARCRIFGIPATKTNMLAMSFQHTGGLVGMLIERLAKKRDIAGLWATWQGFCAAERTYRLRYLGQSGTAKGAAITMVPDRMETDQSMSVDLRDSDQRDQDAKNNLAKWREHLGNLSEYCQKLLLDAELERGSGLWRDGKPTSCGYDTYASLDGLTRVVQGRA